MPAATHAPLRVMSSPSDHWTTEDPPKKNSVGSTSDVAPDHYPLAWVRTPPRPTQFFTYTILGFSGFSNLWIVFGRISDHPRTHIQVSSIYINSLRDFAPRAGFEPMPAATHAPLQVMSSPSDHWTTEDPKKDPSVGSTSDVAPDHYPLARVRTPPRPLGIFISTFFVFRAFLALG